MPNPQNIKGHEFKPGQSGNPKGRPKNRAKDTLVEALKLGHKRELKANMTTEEIKSYEEYLIGASSDDIALLGQDVSIPIYVRALARSIFLDTKNGRTTTLDKLRDRIVGKETQRVELTGADGSDLIPAQRLTEEQAAQLLKKLEEEY